MKVWGKCAFSYNDGEIITGITFREVNREFHQNSKFISNLDCRFVKNFSNFSLV